MVDFEDFENTQLYAGIFVFEILVWGSFTLMASAGWIPAWRLFAVVGGLFNLIILVAAYHVTSENDFNFSGFEVPSEGEYQLSEHEAYELARFILLYRRDMRIDEVVDRGIEPAVTPSEDSDDARRLFKLIFERVNVNEKVGVYLDLEQSIEIDVESYSSLSNAADKVENIRVIRGSKTNDFWEDMQEAQVSMGRNLDSMIRITDDEGNVTEYPTRALPNQHKERLLEVE